MDFKVYRHTYNTDVRNIIGDFHSENGFFCFSLEDEKRADGVKEYGETCIAPGVYDYEVNMSGRFKRLMIQILNVPKFEGIRVHGGNTEDNTLGCVLVAHKTNGKKIWSTAEKEITKMAIDGGGKGKIEIIDAPLSYDKVNHRLY